jgi:hypothetical protein
MHVKKLSCLQDYQSTEILCLEMYVVDTNDILRIVKYDVNERLVETLRRTFSKKNHFID